MVLISGPLLLAFILNLPFLRPATPRTDPRAWLELLAAFQARGVDVSSDHPRCREPNLDGLYVRGQRRVLVCERGDRALTLRHEGWHLAQSLCLLDAPWLSDGEIDQRLTRQDRLELKALVQPERRRREAEARAMANLPQVRYLELLEQACLKRLPAQASSAADDGSPELAAVDGQGRTCGLTAMKPLRSAEPRIAIGTTASKLIDVRFQSASLLACRTAAGRHHHLASGDFRRGGGSAGTQSLQL